MRDDKRLLLFRKLEVENSGMQYCSSAPGSMIRGLKICHFFLQVEVFVELLNEFFGGHVDLTIPVVFEREG